MDKNQETDIKKIKKLNLLVVGLMASIVGVGIIAGVISFNVMEGQVASKSQLIVPIMGPMVVVAVLGAIPLRIMKKKMFPTNEDFERAKNLFMEQSGQKK